MRSSAIAFGAFLIPVAWAFPAVADDAPGTPTLPPDAQVEFSEKPPQPAARPEELAGPGEVAPGGAGSAGRRALDTGGGGGSGSGSANEAPPPPRPRRKGLVLESTVGVLGFAGQFRHVAPPAYWLRAQLGYEPTRWLMVFGAAELAETDTSEAQVPSELRAFWMWGFSGGARATVHAGERVAVFGQGEVGALSAYVPHGALANLGFRSAERLGAEFGAKVGVEWYQKDPHLALSLQAGARYAQGFGKVAAGAGDFPLLWDSALGLRYTF
ncbi:MAG: hypothetical protein JOZ69_23200 [Myxococcales bacterium]|nr:hypothetical protein [Myxococcales bacterium]